ncbi:mechanosensitive ion channel [Salinivibrio sp. VYel9]|nr:MULTISPECIES: mechanosensitive ion channel domain-containing protein [unclassified Salinivibrio]MPS31376.1 mechanosensitive ion channel protein MscS [Salinivibrio sp. VYel7]MPX90504.1 mechanosensitive ion channel [Salinivibrio sp. VYel1]MPX92773.1 mechanosensitive ion channel [Salinivibrio sp. VYel9]MPX95543.1 mechanosensitive ion channel [Salinivibrio sp. VYel6]MPX98991.1 mechanosensitive ion channel [Salinivibrio sp. VYel4]
MKTLSHHRQRMNTVMLVLVTTLLFLPLAHADQAPAPTEPNVTSSDTTSLAHQIARTKQYIQTLVESLEQAKGDDKDAIQLQLFTKNEELRELLADAINQQSLDNPQLIQLVTAQRRYTQDAYQYITTRLNSLNEQITQASQEQRLPLINEYAELQHYLSTTFEASWENIRWLEQLEQPAREARNTLEQRLNQRLRLLSASIDYLRQQYTAQEKQIKSSPDSEKPGLQLTQLNTQQRLTIATDSLKRTYQIADELGIETAEYKRQLFGVTGNITQDILDVDVAYSILSHWSENALNWAEDNAPQLVFQLIIFVLILLVAKLLARLTRSVVKSTVANKNFKFSQLMQDFFVSMSGKAVWVIGILIGLSQIGVNLTPVLTGFGIAGVIIGFALQDTLSNFAAGMMLLIYRPFDVGDFVYAGGVDGKVGNMSLVNTTIRTFDNQIIIVPNSKIWGDVIKNVTRERIRRVDMVFGIGYKDDLLKAEAVLTEIVQSHPAVLRTPEPMIKVHVLNTSSVDFIVRPWVKTDDYWDVYWDVTKTVKLRFDEEGISIPFPQQDVHLNWVSTAPEARSD